MSKLSASKLQKLQNMALYGTPPEQANAKYLLRKHGISEQDQEQYATAAQKPQPQRRNYMAEMDRYRRGRDEERREDAARHEREKIRAEYREYLRQEAQALEQERLDALRHQQQMARQAYNQMLDRKQQPPAATYAYYRPKQQQQSETQSPPNIAFILFLALIIALILTL